VVPLIIAAAVIIGALAAAGYSFYDASEHPERYQSEYFSFRALGNVFGGATVGAAAGGVAYGVGMLGLAWAGAGGTAAAGTGVAAAGTGAAAAGGGGGAAAIGTLTFAQKFLIGGAMQASFGAVWSTGFHGLFPEHVDLPSVGSVTFDFVTGGIFGPGTSSALRTRLGTPLEASFAPRAFGNQWSLMWKGQWLRDLTGGWLGGRYKFSPLNMIWEGTRRFAAVSQQYWRGEAEGLALHHWIWSQRLNLPTWLQGFRNAGWNLMETGGAFNSWMGRGALRGAKEWAFQLAVTSGVATVGYGFYAATRELLLGDTGGGSTSGLSADAPAPFADAGVDSAGVSGAAPTVVDAADGGIK
jgi:hypothetical protein